MLEDSIFEIQIKKILPVFDFITTEWVNKGNSIHGIKDRKEFTRLLQEVSRKSFMKDQKVIKIDNEIKQIGSILNIRISNGKWYGFIKQRNSSDNIYFDNRGFNGNFEQLQPHSKVEYVQQKKIRREIIRY